MASHTRSVHSTLLHSGAHHAYRTGTYPVTRVRPSEGPSDPEACVDTGRSVFDLPVSRRPGGVRGSGREEKTKNKKRRGPSPRMPTDLVQEGCNGRNGRNGRNGPPTRGPDGRCIGHPDLRWCSTTQSTPWGLMVAEAILDLNFQRKSSSWAFSPKTFRLRRA